MNESAVADTGPILHLTKIGQESLFSIFEKVFISEQIRAELERYDIFNKITAVMSDSIIIERVSRQEIDEQSKILSRFKIHQSDLSVAVLAQRILPDVVLIDELELRKGLEIQGYTVVGSLGILFRAFKHGRLTKSELRISIDQLFNDDTIYLSRSLRNHVYKMIDVLVS
jgi:predicted nucleic acid-binding protein